MLSHTRTRPPYHNNSNQSLRRCVVQVDLASQQSVGYPRVRVDGSVRAAICRGVLLRMLTPMRPFLPAAQKISANELGRFSDPFRIGCTDQLKVVIGDGRSATRLASDNRDARVSIPPKCINVITRNSQLRGQAIPF